MKKIKSAFYVFSKSLTSTAYYKDLLNVELKFSIKYLFFLAILAATVLSINGTPAMTRYFSELAGGLTNTVTEAYPEELVVTIEDGQLSMNREEPYVLPMPESEEPQPENLLVIDPEGTVADLETYDTAVLINSANILSVMEGGIKVYPLSDVPNTEITRTTVMEKVDQINNLVGKLFYIFFPIIFLVSLVYYFGVKLAYLLFVAAVLFVLGKARKMSLSFSKYYQISIHAMTLPLVIDMVFAVAGYPLTIPFWFFGLNLLIATAALLRIDVAS